MYTAAIPDTIERIDRAINSLGVPGQVTSGGFGYWKDKYVFRIDEVAGALPTNDAIALAVASTLHVDVGNVGVFFRGLSTDIEVSRPDGYVPSLASVIMGQDISPLTVVLGADKGDSCPVFANLISDEAGNILVVAPDGHGKSTLLEVMVHSLILFNEPGELKILLMDATSDGGFSDVPAEVWGCEPMYDVNDINQTIRALQHIVARGQVADPPIVAFIDGLHKLPEYTREAVSEVFNNRGDCGVHIIAASAKPMFDEMAANLVVTGDDGSGPGNWGAAVQGGIIPFGSPVSVF